MVAQLRQTEASVAEYAEIEARRLGIQVNFALMFAVIALTILMASVLIGLNFANWLVSPIRNLMSAANIVSTGDLQKAQCPLAESEPLPQELVLARGRRPENERVIGSDRNAHPRVQESGQWMHFEARGCARRDVARRRHPQRGLFVGQALQEVFVERDFLLRFPPLLHDANPGQDEELRLAPDAELFVVRISRAADLAEHQDAAAG